jgi:hypothetical protein
LHGAVSLPGGNFAGIVCEPAGDRTIRILFFAIVATVCGKFPGRGAQGSRIEWQGIF